MRRPPKSCRGRFTRGITVAVARDLLGKVVVHRLDGAVTAGRTVETEAYLGSGDRVAHSFAGLTDRTRVIFGPPGHAHVYLVYGMHHCLNFIAERDGAPGCVLLRVLEPCWASRPCGRGGRASAATAKGNPAKYLPTPEQHELGGYETWLGTNRVEKQAAVKVTRALLDLLAAVAAEQP